MRKLQNLQGVKKEDHGTAHASIIVTPVGINALTQVLNVLVPAVAISKTLPKRTSEEARTMITRKNENKTMTIIT